MMKALGARLAHWTHVLILFLKPLGFWGAGAIALLDSSTIPVPMDLILATYIWADRPRAWLYVLMGAAGSAIGGLLPFLIGRAGGELVLLRRMDRAQFDRFRGRFERSRFAALMIPSMLPPPTPWKLFVFAAGVFEMRVGAYLAAVFLGRVARFSILAVLTLRYGPQVVGEVEKLARQHARGLIAGVAVLLLALLAYTVREAWLHHRRSRRAQDAVRDGEPGVSRRAGDAEIFVAPTDAPRQVVSSR